MVIIKKETSIFHLYGNFEEVNVNDSTLPWDENDQGGLAEYGKSILGIIYRYKIINKQSILKCLQEKKQNIWKRDMLSKTLKSLRKSGHIRMFRMTGQKQDEHTLIIYAITEKGADVIEKSEKFDNIESILSNTQECLELLALNQFHINLRYILGIRIRKALYNQFIIKENITVPSFVRYVRSYDSTKDNRNEKLLTLFTYAAPHDESRLEQFFLRLIYNYEFLMENPNYRPAIIVVLCENMNHASWISWKMNKIREMRPLNAFVYALDIMTNKEKMLSLLYTCEADEEGMVRSNISLN